MWRTSCHGRCRAVRGRPRCARSPRRVPWLLPPLRTRHAYPRKGNCQAGGLVARHSESPMAFSRRAHRAATRAWTCPLCAGNRDMHSHATLPQLSTAPAPLTPSPLHVPRRAAQGRRAGAAQVLPADPQGHDDVRHARLGRPGPRVGGQWQRRERSLHDEPRGVLAADHRHESARKGPAQGMRASRAAPSACERAGCMAAARSLSQYARNGHSARSARARPPLLV
jgi:hypothetical protein